MCLLLRISALWGEGIRLPKDEHSKVGDKNRKGHLKVTITFMQATMFLLLLWLVLVQHREGLWFFSSIYILRGYANQ